MKIDLDVFERNYYHTAYLFSRFTVPYMRNVYREFDGDILLYIVLGEIGNRNASRFFDVEQEGAFNDRASTETLMNDETERERMVRPCNTLSISDATGIPRETVRRKVNILIKKNWVQQNEKGHLYLTLESGQNFERLLLSSVESLLPCAQALIDSVAEAKKQSINKGIARKK